VNITLRPLFAGALKDFRRVWPQLLLTDLLARGLAVAVLTPIVGLLLKVFLATTDTGVVTDQAIVSFLLHPAGLAALVVVAAVSLGLLFAETGQLMVIGFGATEDRRVTWLDALLYAYRRAVQLVRLAGAAVVRLLLVSLPFVAAVAAVYWLLLTSYDINFYLANHPPEFVAAVAISGLLVAAMALLVTWKIAGWLLSVPMVLFDRVGGRTTLRTSESVTEKSRAKLTGWIVGWLAATALFAATATFLVGTVSSFVIPRVSTNITLLLVTLSGFLVLSGVLNLAVSFVTTALFPLLVVRVYRSLAGPGSLHPEIAAVGTLDDKPSFRIPGKAVLTVCGAALLVVLGASYLTLGDSRFEDTAQIIAHRGGAAVAPENTMAAFQRCIADRTDWLELDVQENADGTIVVVHDSDFMRIAGSDIKVWNAKNADLVGLDVGGWFAPEFSDQRVPELPEVLELARGKAGIFIELKYYGHDVSLEQKVVDLVEEIGMAARIVVMSLDYDGIRKTADLRPDWTYGLLNAVAIGDLTKLDVDFLALTAGACSPSMIRRTQGRHMKIYAWTINDPVQMWVMMSRGVDGIITDRVELAHHVKDLRTQMTPVGRFIIWMAGESGLLKGMEKSSERDDA
jgi:glycerophosphoryl diester phosphodiesterase